MIKRKILPVILFFSIILSLMSPVIGPFSASPAAAAQAVATPPKAESATPRDMPKAIFPSTRHEFGSVMEGVEIKHDFIIENHGQAPLVISKVRPD
jgi:hypothetical protein